MRSVFRVLAITAIVSGGACTEAMIEDGAPEPSPIDGKTDLPKLPGDGGVQVPYRYDDRGFHLFEPGDAGPKQLASRMVLSSLELTDAEAGFVLAAFPSAESVDDAFDRSDGGAIYIDQLVANVERWTRIRGAVDGAEHGAIFRDATGEMAIRIVDGEYIHWMTGTDRLARVSDRCDAYVDEFVYRMADLNEEDRSTVEPAIMLRMDGWRQVVRFGVAGHYYRATFKQDRFGCTPLGVLDEAVSSARFSARDAMTDPNGFSQVPDGVAHRTTMAIRLGIEELNGTPNVWVPHPLIPVGDDGTTLTLPYANRMVAIIGASPEEEFAESANGSAFHRFYGATANDAEAIDWFVFDVDPAR